MFVPFPGYKSQMMGAPICYFEYLVVFIGGEEGGEEEGIEQAKQNHSCGQ